MVLVWACSQNIAYSGFILLKRLMFYLRVQVWHSAERLVFNNILIKKNKKNSQSISYVICPGFAMVSMSNITPEFNQIGTEETWIIIQAGK